MGPAWDLSPTIRLTTVEQSRMVKRGGIMAMVLGAFRGPVLEQSLERSPTTRARATLGTARIRTLLAGVAGKRW